MNEAQDIETDRTLYAVGDIHGRADLLDALEKRIIADWRTRGSGDGLLIFLGDYIDRGARSREVIERLISGFPLPAVHLRGNHEQTLLDFLDDPEVGEMWRHNGGMETLASYGVPVGEVSVGRGFERAARELRARMPAAHLDFLNGLQISLQVGRYFFCHAGVRPGVPLDAQAAEDLMWIREPFIMSREDFGKVVVHGHTPVEAPELLPNRINIDTGAFLTGKLTCLVIDGEETRFITT